MKFIGVSMGVLLLTFSCKARQNTSNAKSLYDKNYLPGSQNGQTIGAISNDSGETTIVNCQLKDTFDKLFKEMNGKPSDSISKATLASGCDLLMTQSRQGMSTVRFFARSEISIFKDSCSRYCRSHHGDGFADEHVKWCTDFLEQVFSIKATGYIVASNVENAEKNFSECFGDYVNNR